MLKIIAVAAIALQLTVSVKAGEMNVSFDGTGSGLSAVIQRVQETEIPEIQNKWGSGKDLTIMVYINAKNNLEGYGLTDVNEMEAVGSDKKMNVVAELGRITGWDSSDGNWTGSRRYLIQADKDTRKITSPVVMDMPKTDMGDWNHLVEFVKWSKDNYPAKKYLLIVWNHGSGWSRGNTREIWIQGISYDDETGNHITTAQLGQALASMGQIDVYASDACLMQMTEVAYELAKANSSLEVIVGSEETEPGDGYPYDTILAAIKANSSASPAELGKIITEKYTAFYAAQDTSATQSAVNARSLFTLKNELGIWTDMAVKADEKDLIKSAADKAQSFYYDTSKDMRHFIQLVTEGTKVKKLADKGREIISYLDKNVYAANATNGKYYENAYGLAVYVPAVYDAAYDELLWAKDGGWDDFLKWLTSK